MNQITVTKGLGSSLLRSIQRVSTIAKEAFPFGEGQHYRFASDDVLEAIGSLVATVDAPSFQEMLSKQVKQATEFQAKMMPGPSGSGSKKAFPIRRPPSPRAIPRPTSPFSGAQPFPSIESHRGVESPPPKSPPHKRFRGEASEAAPFLSPARWSVQPQGPSTSSGHPLYGYSHSQPQQRLSSYRMLPPPAPGPIASSSSYDPERGQSYVSQSSLRPQASVASFHSLPESRESHEEHRVILRHSMKQREDPTK